MVPIDLGWNRNRMEVATKMSKRMVDISVCIATYNSAKTLRVCLDSILQQSVKPREVLVCDGGSTDGTLKILEEYPVKIVATNMKGVGSARNVLTSAASGKIVAWIDSDVAIAANWLELMEKIHEDHSEIDSLSSLMRLVDTKEAEEKSKIPVHLKKMVLKTIDVRAREISQSALTIKKDVIQRAGGYDPFFEWGEEWDLKIRLSRIGARLNLIQACLAYHIRLERFLKWTERLLLHDMRPRDLIYAGNFLCFLYKYGPWYVKYNKAHFASFVLRLWLLYSLIGIVALPLPALVSLIFAVITNLVACKIHHERLRFGFLLDQLLKALGEHRNFFRVVVYKIQQYNAKPKSFHGN